MKDKANSAPRALSIEEACQRMGVSRTTLYRMAGRGEVTLRKLGTRTFVLEEDVHRLLTHAPAVPVVPDPRDARRMVRRAAKSGAVH